MSTSVSSIGVTKCPTIILGAVSVFAALLFTVGSSAQNQSTPPSTGNQVMGQVNFQGNTKAEKTAGVRVDGQYLGYVEELRGDKKVLLLPGEHNISVRQAGYLEFTQKIVTEPGKQTDLSITLARDPKVQFSGSPAQIKLNVTPEQSISLGESDEPCWWRRGIITLRSMWPGTGHSRQT